MHPFPNRQLVQQCQAVHIFLMLEGGREKGDKGRDRTKEHTVTHYAVLHCLFEHAVVTGLEKNHLAKLFFMKNMKEFTLNGLRVQQVQISGIQCSTASGKLKQ